MLLKFLILFISQSFSASTSSEIAKKIFKENPEATSSTTAPSSFRRISVGDEFFVSNSFTQNDGKSLFIATILNGPERERRVWIQYDPKDPKFKLLTNDRRDKLAESTIDATKTYYLHATENSLGLSDETWWVDILSGSLKKDNPCNLDHQFEGLDKALAATQKGAIIRAKDANMHCPERPQRFNGRSCQKNKKLELNDKAREYVLEAAKEYDLDPAMLAAMIHKESMWNTFAENGYEKAQCTKEACSEYKWSRGLTQFGDITGAAYGLDWSNDNEKLVRPSECTTPNSVECFTKMEEVCKPYEEEFKNKQRKGVPIFCPRTAIRAAAKHLKDAFPKEILMWVRNPKSGKLEKMDLIPALTQSKPEMYRNMVSYFQRGNRVLNSYAEHFETNGKWPENYSEAWNTHRRLQGEYKSPSQEIGYQMLANEFVNRCHIWALFGLCGEVDPNSLMGQYAADFQEQKAAANP